MPTRHICLLVPTTSLCVYVGQVVEYLEIHRYMGKYAEANVELHVAYFTRSQSGEDGWKAK